MQDSEDIDGHQGASGQSDSTLHGCKVPVNTRVLAECNKTCALDPFSELFSSTSAVGKASKEHMSHLPLSMDAFKDRVLLFGEELSFSDRRSTAPEPLGGSNTPWEASCCQQPHGLHPQRFGAFDRENIPNLRHAQNLREDEIYTPKSLEKDECPRQLKSHGNRIYGPVFGRDDFPRGPDCMHAPGDGDDFGKLIDMFLMPSGRGMHARPEERQACGDSRASVGVYPERAQSFRNVYSQWPGAHAVRAIRRDCHGAPMPFQKTQPPDVMQDKKQSQGVWNSRCYPQGHLDHMHLSPGSRCGYPSLGCSPFASRISRTWNGNGGGRLPLMGEWRPRKYAHGGHVGAELAANGSLLIRMKLFRLTQISEIQKMQVWKLVNGKEGLDSKLYRAVSKVAEILGLPQLHFAQFTQLKALDTLFRKCGGVLGLGAEQLNCHKGLLSKCHHMYMSYVLPLVTCNVFYRQAGDKKRIKIWRQDLVLCLSVGTCDDILFMFEKLEEEIVSASLASEILELFFQVSEALLRRLGYEAPSLQRLKPIFKDKAYRHAVEKMPVKLLGNIQEAAFRVLLKHREAGRASMELKKNDVAMVVDALFARKSLPFSPTGPKCTDGGFTSTRVNGMESKEMLDSLLFEPSVCDMIDTWALRFISAAGVMIDGTDEILDALEHAAKHSPEAALRASGMVLMSGGRRESLFLMLKSLIESRMDQHLRTVESKVLLKDNKELEIIVKFYLEYMLESKKELLSRAKLAVESYRRHLADSRVYFFKKNSSAIEDVAETLAALWQSYSSGWHIASIKRNLYFGKD